MLIYKPWKQGTRRMIILLQPVHTVVQILTSHVQSLSKKKFIELKTCILTSLKRSISSYIKRLNLVTYRNNSEISHCGKHYILLLGNLCKEIEEWGTKCKDGMTDTKTQHWDKPWADSQPRLWGWGQVPITGSPTAVSSKPLRHSGKLCKTRCQNLCHGLGSMWQQQGSYFCLNTIKCQGRKSP